MKTVYKFTLFILICTMLCACSAGAPQTDSVCTLIIDCSTALSADDGGSGKSELLPDDGIIYKSEVVGFSKGESVFDILKRELMANKIHFEFNQNPIYFQGIGNIYEGDFGDMSGWVYTVDGESPMVGCDSYFPENGNVICFEYITSWE